MRHFNYICNMSDEEFYNKAEGQVGMLLCLNGKNELLINGKLYHFRRGMLCFMSPLVSVYELSHSDDYCSVYIMDKVEVFYQAVKSIFDTIIKLRLRDYPCLLLNEKGIRLFEKRRELILSKRRLLDSASNKEEQTLLRAMLNLLEQETLLEFVWLYSANCVVNPEVVKKKDSVSFQFIVSLNKNFKKERSVSFYASEANLSSGHFARTVKEVTGKAPSEWIATITIVNAQMLLKQPDKSIKEIAEELNFPEQFTFRKYFKQHVGISPKEYRNLKKIE